MEITQPLDNPEIESAKKPKGKTGLIIELSIGACFVVGIMIRDVFGFPRFLEIGMLSGCLLGIVYLFGNWWLDKPDQVSARTVLMSMLCGLASFALIFSIIFRWLYLPGEYEMRVLTLGLVVVTSLLDAIISTNKPKAIPPRSKRRLTILTVVVLLYMYIDQDSRIRFSYRNYPDFIQHYEQNKGLKQFTDIEKEYFGE